MRGTGLRPVLYRSRKAMRYIHPMPQLLLATNNVGKIAEYDVLLEGCSWEIVTPAALGIALDPDETGSTYEENATMKARSGVAASGLVTLADDSGLEIEALGGEPGVHSARFLGADASYAERFAEIERRLADVPRERRRARFRCVIAVANPRTGAVRCAEGEVFGLIAEARGEGGFGYDPIFWVPQHSATMAELPEHQKNIISHRARAAAGARQILKELLFEHQRR
jgi:XTP/dITP diphosphohydrolase